MTDRREDDTTRARFDKALELAALESAREAARKTARRAAGGYFLLLFVLLVGAVAYQRTTNADIRATNARLERSEIRACERLQMQRERANVSDARQYLLSVTIAQAPRASRVVRHEYAGLARTARYDPPTDCEAAVTDPGGYVRPVSVPFCAADDRARRCGRSFRTVFARGVVRAAQEHRPQPTLDG